MRAFSAVWAMAASNPDMKVESRSSSCSYDALWSRVSSLKQEWHSKYLCIEQGPAPLPMPHVLWPPHGKHLCSAGILLRLAALTAALWSGRFDMVEHVHVSVEGDGIEHVLLPSSIERFPVAPGFAVFTMFL